MSTINGPLVSLVSIAVHIAVTITAGITIFVTKNYP